MRGRTTGDRIKMSCPHCETTGKIRTSKTVTITYRELYFACPNFECGHTWKASLAFVHTISDSACPKLGVQLPKAPIPVPANDRQPATHAVTPRHNANDDDVVPGKAVAPDQS